MGNTDMKWRCAIVWANCHHKMMTNLFSKKYGLNGEVVGLVLQLLITNMTNLKRDRIYPSQLVTFLIPILIWTHTGQILLQVMWKGWLRWFSMGMDEAKFSFFCVWKTVKYSPKLLRPVNSGMTASKLLNSWVVLIFSHKDFNRGKDRM